MMVPSTRLLRRPGAARPRSARSRARCAADEAAADRAGGWVGERRGLGLEPPARLIGIRRDLAETGVGTRDGGIFGDRLGAPAVAGLPAAGAALQAAAEGFTRTPPNIA
jgi:hypothetical protein